MTETHAESDNPPQLENDVSFQEWQACREYLSQFDNIIVDLRKHGFGLITVLLSANGVLFTTTDLEVVAIIGIYVALLILIGGLFRLDRVHEVFIRGTVVRALDLEREGIMSGSSTSEVRMGLSWHIAYWSERLATGTWGHLLYIFFCFAAYALAVGGILSSKSVTCSLMDGFIVFTAVVGVVASVAILWHHKSADALQKEFNEAVNERVGADKDFKVVPLPIKSRRLSATLSWIFVLSIYPLAAFAFVHFIGVETLSACASDPNPTGQSAWPS